MIAEDTRQDEKWDEQNSGTFVDYGDVFVPERELQREIVVRALAGGLPPGAERNHLVVADLGCGAGGLSKELLLADPRISVVALDASPKMLAETRRNLAPFESRVEVQAFELEDLSWISGRALAGCVSSLAIHHLDEAGKQRLYAAVYAALLPGAAFVIADLIKPNHPAGWEIAAKQWDRAVEKRASLLQQPAALEYFRRVNWNNFSDPEPDPVDKPSTLFEQLGWLSSIGFRQVDVYWMDAGHAIFAGFKPR